MSAGREAVKRAAGELLKNLGPLALKAGERAFRLLAWGLASLRRVWEYAHGLPVSKKSLRLRLSVFFAVFLVAAWLCAAFFAWLECRASINEFFDTQQTLFAKRLAETNFAKNAVILPKSKERPPGVDKRAMGHLEDDALGFAVFTNAGQLVMADAKNGRHFSFEPDKKGFSDERLSGGKGDAWRIVRLAAKDGGHSIAVGQEIDYRNDMALDMLGKQLIPWLALLPVLLLGLVVLLGRELAPLRAMAKQLRARTPEDATPLDVGRIPSEALPMAEALNGFFAKIHAMLTRERAFISDAAHELRTPLAGLRVQAQVAAQEGITEKTQKEAHDFLLQGIDRCARLVEQLLALSRLDAIPDASFEGAPSAGLSRGVVDWPALLAELVREYRPKAERKELTLNYELASLNVSTHGYAALISMLLRNLLDNAVLYAPRNGFVRILLENNRLTIENSAPELPEEYASRLGERFFRPPGQEEPGSGLGLSIVKRIAEIHGLGLNVQAQWKKPGSAEIRFRVALNFSGFAAQA